MKYKLKILPFLFSLIFLSSCGSREERNDNGTDKSNPSRMQDDTGESNIMNNRDTADIRHATEQPGGTGNAANTDSANPPEGRNE
jgi:hypothetical protein